MLLVTCTNVTTPFCTDLAFSIAHTGSILFFKEPQPFSSSQETSKKVDPHYPPARPSESSAGRIFLGSISISSILCADHQALRNRIIINMFARAQLKTNSFFNYFVFFCCCCCCLSLVGPPAITRQTFAEPANRRVRWQLLVTAFERRVSDGYLTFQ